MNIKNLRLEAGLTQKQLAEKLNVNQNTVSYWEQGKSSPNRETLYKIADFFHVTVNYVLGLENEKVDAQTIGNNLWWLMDMQNKKLETVCYDLHIDSNIFHRWIIGKEIPDAESFEKIQEYFAVSPTFLVENHHFYDKHKSTVPDIQPVKGSRPYFKALRQRIKKLETLTPSGDPDIQNIRKLSKAMLPVLEAQEDLGASLHLIAIALNLKDIGKFLKMDIDEQIAIIGDYIQTHDKDIEDAIKRTYQRALQNYADAYKDLCTFLTDKDKPD